MKSRRFMKSGRFQVKSNRFHEIRWISSEIFLCHRMMFSLIIKYRSLYWIKYQWLLVKIHVNPLSDVSELALWTVPSLKPHEKKTYQSRHVSLQLLASLLCIVHQKIYDTSFNDTNETTNQNGKLTIIYSIELHHGEGFDISQVIICSH